MINQKFADEPHEYSKKVTGLVKQINEYEVTLSSITANVEILETANRKLQDRFVQKHKKSILIPTHMFSISALYFILRTTNYNNIVINRRQRYFFFF